MTAYLQRLVESISFFPGLRGLNVPRSGGVVCSWTPGLRMCGRLLNPSRCRKIGLRAIREAKLQRFFTLSLVILSVKIKARRTLGGGCGIALR